MRPGLQGAAPGEESADALLPHLRGLRRVGGNLSAVVECAECEGIWLSALAFEGICRTARERPEALSFDRTDRVSPETLPPGSRAYVPCLVCGELMFRRQVRWGDVSSGVVVDVCGSHGLWLDRDELEQVVRFLEGPGRTRLLPGQATELFTRPAPALPRRGGRTRPPARPSNPVLDAIRFLVDVVGFLG